MTRHHHHHHTRTFYAIDQSKLALQPGQQVLFEDFYSYGRSSFSTQFPSEKLANLPPNLAIDAKLFSETMTALNEYIEKTITEVRTKYIMILVINLVLIILTCGLWFVVFLFIYMFMAFSQTKKNVEIQTELNNILKQLNTPQLVSNSFEWKLIHTSAGAFLRLIHSGVVTFNQPQIQQQPYQPGVIAQPMMVDV